MSRPSDGLHQVWYARFTSRLRIACSGGAFRGGRRPASLRQLLTDGVSQLPQRSLKKCQRSLSYPPRGAGARAPPIPVVGMEEGEPITVLRDQIPDQAVVPETEVLVQPVVRADLGLELLRRAQPVPRSARCHPVDGHLLIEIADGAMLRGEHLKRPVTQSARQEPFRKVPD